MILDPTKLTPRILVKRVMSGDKRFRTDKYLETFASLSSKDLDFCYPYRYEDTVELWNSLQNCKIKYWAYTLSTTRNIEHITQWAEQNCEKWAWIIHDKDETNAYHLHIYMEFNRSGRYLRAVANELHIPLHHLQKVRSKSGLLAYLTHENDPDKHHYDQAEIHYSDNLDIKKEIINEEFDVIRFYEEYKDFKKGEIKAIELIDKYSVSFSRQPITALIRTFDRMADVEINIENRKIYGKC